MRTKYRNVLIMISLGVVIMILAGGLVRITGNQWLGLIALIGFALICGACVRLASRGESSALRQPLMHLEKNDQQQTIKNSKVDESNKICPYCGAIVSSYFCNECGNKIE